MALSLYRKYRPNVFADVVGQEHVERTLVNAVTEGNVAHAYLFCGPRGTGKTTTARLLAKALLCEQGPNAQPDGTCQQCTDIAQGSHPDVYELDAASRTGVENVREEIIGRVNFAPTRGRYKVYIIDEVHMLSTAAFNALLKTLEEPPEHVVFMLCTTDPQKVPETIQSRCQRFDFKRFSVEEIVGYLKRICSGEGFTFEEEALAYIAARSNGGMRDATTSLEQLAVFSAGSITLDGTAALFGQTGTRGLFVFANALMNRDAAACYTQIASLVKNGIDLAQFARDLMKHMRDLHIVLLTGGEDGLVACPASDLPKYRKQAQQFGAERLSRVLIVLSELVSELRYSTDARLSMEVACTRLCHPKSDLTLESLSERIAELEKGGVQVLQPAAEQAQPQDDEWGWQTDAPWENHSVQPEEQFSQARTQPETPVQDDGFSPEQHATEPANDPAPKPVEDELSTGAGQPMHVEAKQQEPQTARSTPTMSPARIFQAVLTEVKREDVATGALLNGASLVKEEQSWYLEYPQSASFAMGIASKEHARNMINAALEHVTGIAGVQVLFRLEQSQESPSPAMSFDTQPQQEPSYAAEADDGYFDALVSSAAYYEESAEPATTSAPVFEPDFSAPFGQETKKIDDATAASLADALSAFGPGIKFEEVD